jgi:peptidoglycan/xylan/chitin deacetylase (PgdA/CDA1 family)
MMTSGELRQLSQAGMCIGAHTINHPILSRISADEAWQEIQGSKDVLVDILREPVSVFAYPNGKPGTDYLPEHVQMVRDAGFSAAVSTVWGTANGQQDRYQLPRFTPWDRSKTKFGLRMARNMFRAG